MSPFAARNAAIELRLEPESLTLDAEVRPVQPVRVADERIADERLDVCRRRILKNVAPGRAVLLLSLGKLVP